MSQGFFDALRAVGSPPVTVAYPHEREAPVAGARGSVGFLKERCTACHRCVAACPAACIEVVGEERPTPPAELRTMWLDRGACLLCGACVEVCPTEALVWTPVDELANTDRRGLVAGPDELRPATSAPVPAEGDAS